MVWKAVIVDPVRRGVDLSTLQFGATDDLPGLRRDARDVGTAGGASALEGCPAPESGLSKARAIRRLLHVHTLQLTVFLLWPQLRSRAYEHGARQAGGAEGIVESVHGAPGSRTSNGARGQYHELS
jgi:hypothetical protein